MATTLNGELFSIIILRIDLPILPNPLIAIFPNTPKSKKDFYGNEALNENNLVCRAILEIKKKYTRYGPACWIK